MGRTACIGPPETCCQCAVNSGCIFCVLFQGVGRFADDLHNADDLLLHLDKISALAVHQQELVDTHELVFNHKAFTGRSGTMFSFEGLGMQPPLLTWRALVHTCLRFRTQNLSRFCGWNSFMQESCARINGRVQFPENGLQFLSMGLPHVCVLGILM